MSWFLRKRNTSASLNGFLAKYGVENFHAWEMGTRVVPPVALWPHIIPTLRFAELLRVEFGPTEVLSGFRAPNHNREVGGAPTSLHLTFNALDLKPEDGTPQEWADFLTDLGLNRLGGVGVYATFVHADTRTLMFGRPPWKG